MTTQIGRGQICMQAESKQTYLYIDPWKNSHRISDFWAPLYTPLTPLSLCLVVCGQLGEKRLFVHRQKKQPGRDQRFLNQNAEIFCFEFYTACWIFMIPRRSNKKHQKAGYNFFNKTFHVSRIAFRDSSFSFSFLQAVHTLFELGYPGRLTRCFKCFKLQKLCHSVQNNCTQCSLKPFKNYIHRCHRSKSVSPVESLHDPQTHSWHVSTSTYIAAYFKKGWKSHQLYRDPCSRSSLMWQRAPHSSPDQSLPNRSPISRRDRIEEANISPRDPWLWWGRWRKARDKGKGREGARERAKEREKMGGFWGNEIPPEGGFKSDLSPVSSWLWGKWFFSSSRSSGLVQSTAWETLMIWQLGGGGNTSFLPDASVHFNCSLVGPSGVHGRAEEGV